MNLKNVPPEQVFWLGNGRSAKNLFELLKELKNSDESVFLAHVNNKKNDFYNWVRHSVKDYRLAKQLRYVKDKQSTINILNDRIKYSKMPFQKQHIKIKSKPVPFEKIETGFLFDSVPKSIVKPKTKSIIKVKSKRVIKPKPVAKIKSKSVVKVKTKPVVKAKLKTVIKSKPKLKKILKPKKIIKRIKPKKIIKKSKSKSKKKTIPKKIKRFSGPQMLKNQRFLGTQKSKISSESQSDFLGKPKIKIKTVTRTVYRKSKPKIVHKIIYKKSKPKIIKKHVVKEVPAHSPTEILSHLALGVVIGAAVMIIVLMIV